MRTKEIAFGILFALLIGWTSALTYNWVAGPKYRPEITLTCPKP